ncbi:MAG: glycosyltransferase family 4 protein [Gammaproteobacteria bacterium]|nr:glycosyltransferase [Gammaproteobacteria bacterium]MXX94255.1 glycosyltransferase family 4 protein [Gammaproteobacteria bacterium]MYF52466.1 glycosyltransferase family 4 protein [Gammaproteobacteria bacterium]MYK43655.1 glycosyltransferase family 4 protein [Gammaproteobacteria bacterium]
MPLSAIAVGRLVPVKGFDRLIQAWQKIPIPLDIVGDGPERGHLQSLIQKNGVSDRVRLIGESKVVFDVMRNKDLLVAPSHREGFSYVILEALQFELCVISTKTGIAPDLIPEEFLLEQPTTKLLTERIKCVIENFAETQRKFQPAWEQAKQFTVERMVKQTAAIYRDSVNHCH